VRPIETVSVEWRFQKTDAEHTVHKLTGVVGIVNQIRILAAAQAFQVREKIQ
jgi:hypothetical protein